MKHIIFFFITFEMKTIGRKTSSMCERPKIKILVHYSEASKRGNTEKLAWETNYHHWNHLPRNLDLIWVLPNLAVFVLFLQLDDIWIQTQAGCHPNNRSGSIKIEFAKILTALHEQDMFNLIQHIVYIA
jgi:hypothetical protein